jgi:uncharacterized coiled-coil DUF342 family protein
MQTMAGEERQMEERFDRVNERFDEVNRRIREGREETNRRFDQVEGAIVELRQGVAGVQATLNRFNASLAVAVIAVVMAIVLKGG